MQRFEYKSVPAPKKGEKAKGVKGSDGRMALAMTTTLNDMAEQGWEYLRADTLPLEERSGLTSRTVHYYTVLVFRRAHQAQGEADFGVMPALEPEEAADDAAQTAQTEGAEHAPEADAHDENDAQSLPFMSRPSLSANRDDAT